MKNRFTDRLEVLRSKIDSEMEPDSYFINIIENIEDNGLSVTSVVPREGAKGLSFSYSIGMYDTYGQPEIIISGFAPSLANSVINAVAERFAAGDILSPDDRWADLLGGDIEMIFKPMNRLFAERMMLSCTWLYGKDFVFPSYQCIYPDLANTFPWEEGFDERWRKRQALLYEGAEITSVEQEILEE